MSNVQIRTRGLTFLHTKAGQVTVWEGEPLESKMVTTATVDGLVMGDDGPVALVEVLDEENFTAWADSWLEDNPQYLPLTPEQLEAQSQVTEIVKDLMNDPEIAEIYEASVGQMGAVHALVMQAAHQVTNVAQAKIVGGMPPHHAGQQATLEAMTGLFVAGFYAGKTFNQRGYTL